MSYVLAIESNREQARVLRDTIASSAAAKVLVVETVGSAMRAIDREVPSLILVNALLPPKDESELVERVRTLPRDIAPEILITPALSSGRAERATLQRRLFGRRESRSAPAPCAPVHFTAQLSAYLSFVKARGPRVVPAPVPEALVAVSAPVVEQPVQAPEPSGADRRASVRIERVDWATARINGTPVKIVDLSVTGAQILSPTVLRLGGSVHVMLSGEAELVQCDAGIVWGAFEIAQAATPLFRAGLNFKDADRSALEQICLKRLPVPLPVRPDGPRYEPRDW